MNRQKRFRELFRFREDIRSKSSKMTRCKRSQRPRRYTRVYAKFCEYLRENEKFRKTKVLPVEFFFIKRSVENIGTLSL